jgi:uncharacterized protein (DUF1800 family)
MSRSHTLLLTALLACGSLVARASTDFNGDGLCDVWQQHYNAWDLLPDGDEDGDGCSNYAESVAGTDPRDPNDCVRIGDMMISGNMLVFHFKSQAGKRYDLMQADNPAGPFTAMAGAGKVAATANANDSLSVARPAGAAKFYNLRIQDVDADGDGVSDWAERKMGTNPNLANSSSNASGGAANDGDTLRSLMSIQVEVVEGEAYERVDKGAPSPVASPARLRLTRSFGTMPLNLQVTTGGGAPDGSKSDASAADFTAAPSVFIPANGGTAANPVNYTITPVQDDLPEVPEYLKVSFSSGAVRREAVVRINDAEPGRESNQTLYVAYLGREAGVNSTASGIATALVNGDNDAAFISLTFSNLSSPQNTAYLRIENDLELLNIGLGQVTGRQWRIRAAQTKFTDQAMLNALLAGQLYISITTADNPTGELRGYFNRATGSTEFNHNPAIHDAPTVGSGPWQTPVDAALERDIWRFLDQSTYGGTDELFAEVLAEVQSAIASGGTYLTGYSNWLDKQMNPAVTPNASLMQLVLAADNEEFILRGNKPLWAGNDPQFGGEAFALSRDAFGNVTSVNTTTATIRQNNHPFHNNRRREMWTLAMQAKAQVRQRMAQALSEITVISELDTTVQSRHYGAANYWDMLADGAFGKYRDILEKVTYSPMMGIYLSHLRNRAAYVSGGVAISPDENYAREIMQLFSIGLVLRHPDGSLVLDQGGLPVATYDNTDITELARVLTGFAHGARHNTESVRRYNNSGLVFNNAANVRSSPNIQFQTVNYTNFTEGGGETWFQAPWLYPMKMMGKVGSTVYHDFGPKTLLAGKHGQTQIPARNVSTASDAQSHAWAEDDVRLAHNMLAGNPNSSTYDGHQNTPVNISRWLIQRFTTSNPSAGYLYRVSEVYRQTNGNLGAVLKAILLDYEARSLQLADNSISQGRMKEPLVHFMSIMRGLKARSGAPLTALRDFQHNFGNGESMLINGWPDGLSTNLPQSQLDRFVDGATRFRFPDQTNVIGQSPLRAPSVFNWFLPDYTMPGPLAQAGLFAPEMQIATESSLVTRVNRLWTFTWMNLEGMAVIYPGVDVDDFPVISNNAATQVRVSLTNTNTVSSYGSSRQITFTTQDWNTAQTIHVAAVDDNRVEGAHQTRIFHTASSTDANYNNAQLPAVDVFITDNNGGGGQLILEESDGITVVAEASITDTYTLRLSAQPGSDVTVNVIPNAQITVTPSVLTFTSANWSAPQVVTVAAVNDSVASERIHPGFIAHVITSNDPLYRGMQGPDLTVFVGDNNQAGSNAISVRHTEGTTVVREGGPSDLAVIALDRQPSTAAGGIVTVTIASHPRLTISPQVLQFDRASNWWVPQVVTVTAVDDDLPNGTQTINLGVTSVGGGYTSSSTLAVTVHDNDSVPPGSLVVVESGGDTRVTEASPLIAGNRDSYTIRLSSQPTANVTVTVFPERHPAPLSSHAKLMGYFTSDASQSNDQRDRIIFDFTGMMALYDEVFSASPGISNGTLSTTAQRNQAHFAATLAVLDKMDLMWTGGQLKAQLPQLTLADLNNAAIVHPRKSVMLGAYNSYSNTRLNTGGDAASFINETRRRVQIIAYLVALTPQSFVLK